MAPFELLKGMWEQNWERAWTTTGECRKGEGCSREGETAAPSQSVAMATPGREAACFPAIDIRARGPWKEQRLVTAF